LAFERSARQAGFFEHGDDRLVAPLVVIQPEEADKLERGLETAESRATQTAVQPVSPGRHLLIEGLLEELPAPHSKWTPAERVRWLRLAASAFDVLYVADDKLVVIEIKALKEGEDGETH
jgi:hypothetical protein